MKLDSRDLLLYAVTDRSWTKESSLLSQVKEALEGGVTMIQLREKNLNKDALYKEAEEIKELCKNYKVPFIINDDVELASAIDADGIHIGQQDMAAKAARKKLGSQKIIGVSVQTVEQARLAEAQGADYLGVGAVFPTGSKSDAVEVSHQTLKEICQAVSIPIVAIGGIGQHNAGVLKGTGICGVAVISAIFAQKDIKKAAEDLKKIAAKAIRLENNRNMKTALSIAGSDSSGGAGIQADIKTMLAHGIYAMSAITALTAQNTLGVSGIMEVSSEFLEQQLDAVCTDIMPDAVKVGMVASSQLIKTIAKKLEQYEMKNIVVDPVMVATSGARLISEEAVDTLKEYLFPKADLLTPNIPEAEVLTGMHIQSPKDMMAAAEKISKEYGCAVLCKGGHQINDANDLLYKEGNYQWFKGRRINNPNTHGTGCTLSSAIASNLAKGCKMDEAVLKAKRYISMALEEGLDIGKGSGPMNHGFAIEGEY